MSDSTKRKKRPDPCQLAINPEKIGFKKLAASALLQPDRQPLAIHKVSSLLYGMARERGTFETNRISFHRIGRSFEPRNPDTGSRQHDAEHGLRRSLQNREILRH